MMKQQFLVIFLAESITALAFSRDFLLSQNPGYMTTADFTDCLVHEEQIFQTVKKKKRRAGKTKSSLFFLNAHGRQNMERLCKVDDLGRHSLVFLSETWLMPKKASSLLSNKDTSVYRHKRNPKVWGILIFTYHDIFKQSKYQSSPITLVKPTLTAI